MTVDSFTVNGKGYVWYNYTEPLDVLNASDFNSAQSNIETIRDILNNKGYEIPDLDKSTASYNTPLYNVIDKLNAVEYNLDVIDSSLKSIFFGETYRAVEGKKAHNKEQIWRWFQILNDLKEIAIGNKGFWGYLLCNDGYPTIKNSRITTRGDLIG